MQTNTTLDRAAGFIWRHARLIDRHRFAHRLLGAPAGPILAALRAYQNADGGFGNALEPDIRTPDSQPVPVEAALRILDETGCFDDAMVARACDFLETITTPEGGVPFVLASAEHYPCAPWWRGGDDSTPSLNPTAAIAGLLTGHGVDHPWVARATAYCWQEIEARTEPDEYDARCIFTFLERVPDRDRADPLLTRLATSLLEAGKIRLNPSGPHAHPPNMPLHYAPSPESPLRRLFSDDTIADHLKGLAAEQQPDGGWPIAWEPPGESAALEWRGFVTLDALTVLRAYGRL